MCRRTEPGTRAGDRPDGVVFLLLSAALPGRLAETKKLAAPIDPAPPDRLAIEKIAADPTVDALRLDTPEGGTDWTMVMAGNVLMTFPVVVIFFLFQRYFITGMTMSAVKG